MNRSRRIAALALTLAAGSGPVRAATTTASGTGGPGLGTLLATWLPILLIVVAWFWFVSRSGVSRHKLLQERSLAHMARLEQQNEEILKTLRRIEKALGGRGIDADS